MSNLKLWKLMQNTNTGYDTFDSCIVAAFTAEQAKLQHPRNLLGNDHWRGKAVWSEQHNQWVDDETDPADLDKQDNTNTCWAPPSEISCEYLGFDTQRRIPEEFWVLCSSFNAG